MHFTVSPFPTPPSFFYFGLRVVHVSSFTRTPSILVSVPAELAVAMTSTGPARAARDGTPPKAQETVAAQVSALPPIPVLLGMQKTPTATSSSPPRTSAKLGKQSPRPVASSTALVPLSSDGTPPPDADVSSRAAWKRVGESLDLPLVYRKAEDVALTLRLLRQFPTFARLTDDELLSLAAQMVVFSTRGKGVVVCEKAAASAEPANDDEYAVALSSEDEDATGVAALAAASAARSSLGVAAASSSAVGASMREPGAEAVPPNATAGARRSCATRASRASATSTALTAAEEYPETPLYAVAQGHALLEMHTANGKRHFPVHEHDTIGLDLHWRCLPAGSRYVTTEPCTLIKWTPTPGSRLSRVLRRCQKSALEQQITFLTTHLKVPLFATTSDDGESRADEVMGVARCILPLRVSARQVVVEEGELADCMFFVEDGSLAVTRTVVQPASQATKPSPASPPRSGRAPQSTSPRPSHARARVMEVAELHRGELFGELSLICYNPDKRPGEGVVWDTAYWREALLTRFLPESQEAAAAAAADGEDEEVDFIRSLRRARRSTTTTTAPCADSVAAEGDIGSSTTSAPYLKNLASSAGAGNDGVGVSTNAVNRDGDNSDDDDDDSAVYEELRYPPQPAPRLATVYARTPSVVYWLSFTDCRRKIHGKALTCLCEFAKGYPAHGDLLEEFEKKERWNVYKQTVVEEAVKKNPNRRAKAPLAPFKH